MLTILKTILIIQYLQFTLHLKTNKFKLQGNLYYMDFDNEITLLGSLGSYSLQQFGNVEQSYRSGLELDMIWKVHNEVTLKYNGSFSKNKILITKFNILFFRFFRKLYTK